MTDMMGNLRRTHWAGTVHTGDIGKKMVVAGFAQRTRDLGNLIFIDLRDRTGIVQLAFDDGSSREIFAKAQKVRAEFVLMAEGVLRERESVNREIPTGEVELYVSDLRVLSLAETPPFEIVDGTKAKEELRLRHRSLDLRRPEMQKALFFRHKMVKAARDYYDAQGFLEIETPILIKSTPEGARDYLVPSRVHEGKFYALPQSPQLYKQLLMVSGYDRYMQIAKCFRDEDLRADRQPEFTQIDLEMSFVGREDIMAQGEGFVKYVFEAVLDRDVRTPFRRLTYKEAMERFGSDKPDTRFGMELVDLGYVLHSCAFQVFAGALKAGGAVKAIKVEGAASVLSRKEIDKLADFVRTYRAKGLAFTRLTGETASSSYEKFLSREEADAIREAVGAKTGDVILAVADADLQVVYDSLGALRVELAKRLELIPRDSFDMLWVTDFPLFEYDPEEDRYVAKHHPFTAPVPEDLNKLDTNPGEVRALAYDIVINGCEVGGGSIRISDQELQSRMFARLGFTPEDAQARFGFLLDAFKYGVPPHGGMAFGLDRLIMLMLDLPSIRDVIAFPKVQNASELMSGAPDVVPPEALRELHIEISR